MDGMRLSFGPFAFDRQSRLLWRDGTEVALPPRVLGVLEVLIDRAGQVVARQDLLDGVWKDAFVTDTSLAEAVSYLRQALGDDPQAPTYIQTVHRRGYRFLAPVTPDRGQTPADAVRGLTPDRDFAVASERRAVSATSEAVKPSIAWQLLPWSVALLCAAAAIAAVWRLATGRAVPDPPPIARFELRPVKDTSFDTRAPALAISPDGGTLAWAACADDGSGCALYTRRVDRLDAARLPGTDGAAAPFFSPDGRWIGFFADGKLKKIAAAGGSPAILADAPFAGGATWSPGGWIAFAGLPAGGLSLVDDQGGRLRALTAPRLERGELRHIHPAWLSSGALLFVIASSPLPDAPGELAVLAPAASDWRILRTGVTRAASPGPGYLLFSAGPDLQVATFDERRLALTGSADSVIPSVTGGDGITHFAVGGETLLAMPRRHARAIVWHDGRETHTTTAGASAVVSPDGRRIAAVEAQGSASDVWISDLSSGEKRRISYGGSNVSPAWTPDGTRVVFATRTTGPYTLATRRADQGDEARTLPAGSAPVFPSSVASDGRIAVTTVVPGGRTAVAIVPPGGGAPHLLDAGPFNERGGVFSPDGQWLALESDESGRTEIVARAITGGRRLAVSVGGGSIPRWSADGRFLYYESGQRVVRAALDLAANAIRARDTVVERSTARIVAIAPSGGALLARDPGGTDRGLVVLQWLRETRQWLTPPVTAPR